MVDALESGAAEKSLRHDGKPMEFTRSRSRGRG